MTISAADQAWSDQYDQQEAAKQAQEAQAAAPKQPPSFLEQWAPPRGQVTLPQIDSAMSAAESMWQSAKDAVSDPAINDSPGMRVARDVTAGAVTGATNTADSVMSAASHGGFGPGTQIMATLASPIWEHAKGVIQDFRDAAAVQDPTLADNLVQGAGQLMIPFAGYSRALAGFHGLANTLLAGVATDATALDPHAPRMADLFALGRQTEGKLGEVLRAISPDGSHLNAYINYLTDRSTEGEAEGRFKNVLDGAGVNLLMTPLLMGAATVLKQGQAGLRYAVANGVSSFGELGPLPGSRAAQTGQIGYHGSPLKDLSELKPSERLSARGHGIYLSEDKAVAGSYVPSAGGKLYHVDVPDEQVAQMLHWDESLKKQPIAQHAFAQAGVSGDMTAGEAYRALSDRLNATGAQFGGDKQASETLSAAGVPGIRYPASGKLSQGGSTKENIVVFDSKHAKIVKPPEPAAVEKK